MGKLGGVLGLEHLKKSYSDDITEEDFSLKNNSAQKQKDKAEPTGAKIVEEKDKAVEKAKAEDKPVKAKKAKTVKSASASGDARVTARISEDFDRAISLYCIENDVKRIDLAKEALSQIVGVEGSPISLKGDNCKVTITRDDRCKVLSFRINEDLKKAIRKYVFESQKDDPDVSENFVLAQAIADFIGYKKKMRFN